MNFLSLPVVQPSFQRLKKNAGSLHLVAAGLILTHAITHFEKSNHDFFYTGCLIFIAIDISILAIAVRHVLTELPQVNLLSMDFNAPAEVTSVGDQSSELLEVLKHKNIHIGTVLEVKKKFSFDNSLELKIKNQPAITISEQLARSLFVKPYDMVKQER